MSNRFFRATPDTEGVRLIPDDALAAWVIIQEAEGEGFDGMLGVGEVIATRTKRHYSSDGTVAGTVLRLKQFSCFDDDRQNNLRLIMTFNALDSDKPRVADAVRAWEAAKAGSNLTHGAVLYLNPAVVSPLPSWADPAKEVAVIGRHHFFSA